MKSKLHLVLAFCLLLTGCGTSDQKTSIEKANNSSSTAATPEVVVNQVITEPTASPQAVVKTETVRDGVIISDNANLRETGSSESVIIDTIPEGAAIEVLKQKGVWFYVRVDEKTGWLHGDTFRFGRSEDNYLAEEEFLEIETPSSTTYTVSTPVPLPSIEAKTKPEAEENRNYRTETRTDSENIYSSTPTYPSYSEQTPTNTPDSIYSPSYNSTPGVESVRGYTRRDGTYVAPYKRTKRNSTTSDNWSTKGNINPYTGKRGTRRP